MNTQKSGKKVVSRNVAVALGIISIVFLVGLVGAVLHYTSIISGKDNDILTRDSQIADKNAQIQTLTDQKNQLQTWLQENNSVANFEASSIWVNLKTVSVQASSETIWNFTANYAGYISIQVASSPPTTGNFYARVTYASHGVNYDNQINVGTSGTAVFPVLPALIETRVGNLLTALANATVTISYYY
jgi:cell division protein FtsL